MQSRPEESPRVRENRGPERKLQKKYGLSPRGVRSKREKALKGRERPCVFRRKKGNLIDSGNDSVHEGGGKWSGFEKVKERERKKKTSVRGGKEDKYAANRSRFGWEKKKKKWKVGKNQAG